MEGNFVTCSALNKIQFNRYKKFCSFKNAALRTKEYYTRRSSQFAVAIISLLIERVFFYTYLSHFRVSTEANRGHRIATRSREAGCRSQGLICLLESLNGNAREWG